VSDNINNLNQAESLPPKPQATNSTSTDDENLRSTIQPLTESLTKSKETGEAISKKLTQLSVTTEALSTISHLLKSSKESQS